MKTRLKATSLLFATLALLAAVFGIPSAPSFGLQSGAAPEAKNLIPELDGKALFHAYCASCHGADAEGGGPAALALRKKPVDLTRIAARNKGTFPAAIVERIISGDDLQTAAHGSREMPIWGPVFGQIAWDQDLGRVRIHNLMQYIQSLQRRN